MHAIALLSLLAGGHIAEQSRNVGTFTGVQVAAGIQARIEAGALGPITVRGPDDVLPHLRTEVKGSQLVIGFEPGSSGHSNAPVTVAIRMPRADQLGVSGGAEIEANVPAADGLELHASGGGHIRLTAAVKPQKLVIAASGGAEITLAGTESASVQAHGSGGAVLTMAGKADSLTLDLSGGTQVHAGKLWVGSLEVHGSGGGEAEVNAGRQVRGSLSGGTTLRVAASAQVDVRTSGGAEVIRK
jgi:Putative auto-transporter adhesin, head GIN domain